MEKLALGLLPVFGVILGAILQHQFSKSKELSGRINTQRTQVYTNYLNSVGFIAVSQRYNFDNHIEILSRLTASKGEMCIYGSEEVIEKLAQFEESGAVLDNEKSLNLFIDLAVAMRLESGSKNPENLRRYIKTVLFS